MSSSNKVIYGLSGAIFGILMFVLIGCGDDKNVIKLKRFDQDLFALDTTNLKEGMNRLLRQYPEMLPLFTVQIIHDQTNPSETPEQALAGFLKASEVRQLYDTVQKVYGDLRWLEKDLSKMFRQYKHYFPEKPVPQVVTIISEYGIDAFTASDTLCGIGLDLFLGENYRGYNPEIFPDYIRRCLQKDYISVRLAKALAKNLTPPAKEQRLLDIMLENGKMLYIVDRLLPDTPDSLKMGYTAKQMGGCYANEQEGWARLLEQNLLYSSDFTKYRKLVTPSPNAPVLFQETPGEFGNYLGWQIVKAWANRNPNASMTELLNFRDAQKFLEAAKYKPNR
jgi:hypothetical protein